MTTTKYRLVKQECIDGSIFWKVEKKTFLLGWMFITGYANEERARYVLTSLRSGIPFNRETVIDE